VRVKFLRHEGIYKPDGRRSFNAHVTGVQVTEDAVADMRRRHGHALGAHGKMVAGL